MWNMKGSQTEWQSQGGGLASLAPENTLSTGPWCSPICNTHFSLKWWDQLAMVTHTWNPSPGEAEHEDCCKFKARWVDMASSRLSRAGQDSDSKVHHSYLKQKQTNKITRSTLPHSTLASGSRLSSEFLQQQLFFTLSRKTELHCIALNCTWTYLPSSHGMSKLIS